MNELKKIVEIEDKRIFFVPGVMDRFGVSKTTVHEWVTTGLLPEPHWFGRRRYWLEDEISNVFVLGPTKKIQ